MPRLDRILETALYASDLVLCARFYEEILGLVPLSRVEGRHVFFRMEGAMLLLFQPDRTAESVEVPAHGARGPGHVAFAIDREAIADWRRHFREHAIDIEKEVQWPSGGYSLYVRDPAGNSVELATPDTWPLGG